jgi:hypothetical protein
MHSWPVPGCLAVNMTHRWQQVMAPMALFPVTASAAAVTAAAGTGGPAAAVNAAAGTGSPRCGGLLLPHPELAIFQLGADEFNCQGYLCLQAVWSKATAANDTGAGACTLTMSPLPSPTTALFLTKRSTAARAAALRQQEPAQQCVLTGGMCALWAHRFASLSLLALHCTLRHDRVRQRACGLLHPCRRLFERLCYNLLAQNHPPGQGLVLCALQHGRMCKAMPEGMPARVHAEYTRHTLVCIQQ